MGHVVFQLIDYKVGGWEISVHSRHGSDPNNQKHVHICRNGLDGSYSWNIDGSRHDKHRFPKNNKSISKAKDLAATALGLPKGRDYFQLVTNIEGGVWVRIYEAHNNTRAVFSTYVHKEKTATILLFDERLIVVISEDEASVRP